MKMPRYLSSAIKKDLNQKMVFIGGPRQVGKTTLGLSFLKPTGTEQAKSVGQTLPALRGSNKISLNPVSEKHPAYLNWDIPRHRKIILQNRLPLQHKMLVLDEIHKYKKWRALMKGLYDENHSSHSFLVTGSAHLGHFSKGGDSLVGRYFYHRLHPFSLMEMNTSPTKKDLSVLLKLGGFPEPLFRQSESAWRRWQNNRNQQVIYDDLRDLERVKEISLIDLLLESLPERVGSPLSINALSEDLEVSHQTVSRWIHLLEVLYLVFRIPPYSRSTIRAVKKEQKLYFWDWSQVEREGFRFENLTGSHLLKYCHYHQDTKGIKMELRYLRDTDKREVDFLVLKNKKPFFAVECKTKDSALSSHLRYFQQRLSIPECFQVHLSDPDFGNSQKGGRSLPFITFCKEILKL